MKIKLYSKKFQEINFTEYDFINYNLNINQILERPKVLSVPKKNISLF